MGVVNCGKIPAPALALYGFQHHIPSIMVTGSHIPADRNGIKFNKARGEILKVDEAGIRGQSVVWEPALFHEDGSFQDGHPTWMPPANPAAGQEFVSRYLEFFPADCLRGLHVGVYEHSSVAREYLSQVLGGLGARVTRLGYSDRFVPVDTEALRPEDVQLARAWSARYGFDAIVSTDGDGDRPLISDETGAWLRGDVAGILCARYLDADAVITPVSSNTAVERAGLFQHVGRTRIGSPFVIEGMQQAVEHGFRRVVGYEANGGCLTASDIVLDGRRLRALPTRDAFIVPLSILASSQREGLRVSELVLGLPGRFTASGRLKDFPVSASQAKLAELWSGDAARDKRAVESAFGGHFGPVSHLDVTDGLRITFANGEVMHLRASGNAPEFRCYSEADAPDRAEEINGLCLSIMEAWRP